jgi:hypothetical protein
MFTKMSLGRSAMLGIAVLAAITFTAPQAHAGFIATIEQVGSDVVMTGSGTINTAGLTLDTNASTPGFVYPTFPAILFNDTSPATFTIYSMTTTGPSAFGTTGDRLASSGNGDVVGFESGIGQIALPVGYTSGGFLSDSMTFTSTTIAALGITPGTYTWTWGSAGNGTADFFEVTTNTSSVPEPTSVVLVGNAMLGLLALRRRSCRQS